MNYKAADKNHQISGLKTETNVVTISSKLISGDGATVNGGSTYAFKLNGKGKLVADANAQFVSLVGSDSNDMLINLSKEAGTLDGGRGNDEIKAGEKGDYIIAGTGNDNISLGGGKDTYVYGGGKDVVYGFNNDSDTVVLTAGLSVKEAATSDNNLLVKVGSGSITFLNMANSDVQIGDAIYHGDLVYNTEMTRATINGGDVSEIVSTATFIDGSGVSSNLTIDRSGTSTAQTIIGGKKNDIIYGGTGADSLIGGTGNDTIIGNGGNDTLYGGTGKDIFVFNTGNGADVIADYAEGQDQISLGSGAKITDYALSGSDVVLVLSSTDSITVTDGAGKKIKVNGEENIYGDHMLYNSKKTNVEFGASYTSKDTFNAEGTLISINASVATVGVNIAGNAKSNIITGSATGNNTLYGGKGNDTLIGGDGSDTFVYVKGEGNKVIKNFSTENDNISIGGGITDVTKFVISDKDAIIYVGSNRLTVEGIVEDSTTAKVNVNDKVYTFTEDGYSEDNSMTLFATANSDIAVGNATTIDGDDAKYSLIINATNSASSIIGGQKADIITGGDGNDEIYGGAGNDQIIGGKGADTLYGGAGKDIFVFNSGDGNDVIADFTTGDRIRIDSGTFVVTTDAKDLYIAVDDKETITVQNAANVKVSITDADGKTSSKVYGVNYGNATSNERTLELFDTNNFLSDTPVIDDITTITDTNYAVGKVGTGVEDISKTPNYVAYSDDDK